MGLWEVEKGTHFLAKLLRLAAWLTCTGGCRLLCKRRPACRVLMPPGRHLGGSATAVSRMGITDYARAPSVMDKPAAAAARLQGTAALRVAEVCHRHPFVCCVHLPAHPAQVPAARPRRRHLIFLPTTSSGAAAAWCLTTWGAWRTCTACCCARSAAPRRPSGRTPHASCARCGWQPGRVRAAPRKPGYWGGGGGGALLEQEPRAGGPAGGCLAPVALLRRGQVSGRLAILVGRLLCLARSKC